MSLGAMTDRIMRFFFPDHGSALQRRELALTGLALAVILLMWVAADHAGFFVHAPPFGSL
jgi:hypothetical protein